MIKRWTMSHIYDDLLWKFYFVITYHEYICVEMNICFKELSRTKHWFWSNCFISPTPNYYQTLCCHPLVVCGTSWNIYTEKMETSQYGLQSRLPEQDNVGDSLSQMINWLIINWMNWYIIKHFWFPLLGWILFLAPTALKIVLK